MELVGMIDDDLDLEESLRLIKNFLVSGDRTKTPVCFRRQAKKYQVKSQYLFRRSGMGLGFIPSIQQRKLIISACHDKIGHWGISATINFVARTFWWPTMRKDVSNFVKSYRTCQICANEKNIAYDHHQPVNCIFDTFCMDFAGPLTETKRKCRYTLLSVEHLTDWIHSRATAGQMAGKEISFFKDEIVKQFGSPSVVLTNQGPEFLSAAWKNELKLKGTDARVTATDSPQSNGRAERMVQTIKSAITRMVMDRETEWDELLPIVVNYIQAKKCRDGYSPYEIMFPASPDCLWSPVMKPVEQFGLRDEEVDQDPNRNSRIMEVLVIQSQRAERSSVDLQTPINTYSIDDWVLVRKPVHVGRAALAPKWMGPCNVVAVRRAICWLRDEGGRTSRAGIHVRGLKPFIHRL